MEIRNRIIEAAASLFKIYGIRSVTMDSLANHLGVSKRTIYELFADKDELLGSVLDWMAEKQRALIVRILEDSENAISALFRLLQINRDHVQDINPVFYSDLRKYHYDVMMKKSGSGRIPDYRNNVKIIERGVKEKLFRKDINPGIVTMCLYSLGRSVMDFELYASEEFTRQEVIKNVIINYLKGISTSEGIALITKLEAEF